MSSSTEQNRPAYVEERACSALQPCLTLCNAVDCSPPGSSVHGILQARTRGRAAVPASRGSSRPRDRTCVSDVSCFGRWVLCNSCHFRNLTVFIPASEQGPQRARHNCRHRAFIAAAGASVLLIPSVSLGSSRVTSLSFWVSVP